MFLHWKQKNNNTKLLQICFIILGNNKIYGGQMKLSKFIFIIIICFFISLNAGWGPEAHKNLLKESIRILPIFDYEMCTYYKEFLYAGIIEGEIQFKYKDKGTIPNWLPATDKVEVQYLNGIPIDESNYQTAADFFSKRFENLRSDIVKCRRKYSDVFYELGYYLTAINNILIPLYEEGNYPEQHYAKQTSDLVLDPDKVIKIENMAEWLENRFSQIIKMRSKWTEAAKPNNSDEFKKISHEANLQQIYNMSNVISFVLGESFGPGHPEARKHVQKIHEKNIKLVKGRKPLE